MLLGGLLCLRQLITVMVTKAIHYCGGGNCDGEIQVVEFIGYNYAAVGCNYRMANYCEDGWLTTVKTDG